jgi:hypothetical protein
MYKSGETALDRILTIVDKCPKEFQSKCFEVLLSGYVQMEVGAIRPQVESYTGSNSVAAQQQPGVSLESNIPQTVLPRFKNTAKRVGVELEKLEALFDFNADPFGLHAVAIPGKNNAEKTRSVALLAAARSYLATGSWSADWQEVKALCVDQTCYDLANYSGNLKKGAGSIYKSVESGKPIELSSAGIKEAEKLLKTFAEGLT